jgi:hypothetical protein
LHGARAQRRGGPGGSHPVAAGMRGHRCVMSSAPPMRISVNKQMKQYSTEILAT